MRWPRRTRPDPHSKPSDLPAVARGRWGLRLALWVTATVAWLAVVRFAPDVVLGAASDDTAVSTLRDSVAVVLPIVLVVLAVHAFWRLRLETLAYRPGPLLVYTITDNIRSADGPGSGRAETPLAENVRAELQRRLVGTRLHGSTAIPSPGRSSDFVQVVEETGERSDGLVAAVLRLPRVLGPRAAYEVRCTLNTALDAGRADDRTLLVELTRAPAYGLAPQTFTGDSWADVTARAANWICAMILPRTRKCATAPWSEWRGLRLPPALFAAHQQFRDQQHEDPAAGVLPDPGREATALERAGDALDVALRLDPLNIALRLERGKLLERRKRYLEALETYDGILAQAARRDRRLAYLRFGPPPDNPADPDPDAGRRWSDSTRARERGGDESTVFVARYRFALLLGLGPELAEEWWPGDRSGPDRLNGVRRSLRKRMATAYEEPIKRLAAQFGDLGDRVTTDVQEFLGSDVAEAGGDTDRRRRSAALFFTSVGLWEVEHLLTERPIRGVPPGADDGGDVLVPRRSITLLLPRAILRRALAIRQISAAADHVRRAEHSMLFPIDEPVLEPALGSMLERGWPGNVDQLLGWIDELLTRRRGALRSWHEHYNAACVVSLLLTDRRPEDDVPGDVRTRIAEAAVAELEKAVACGDSGFLASQSSWIRYEDPDLTELRETEPFQDFQITVLGRTPDTPRTATPPD